MSALIRFGNALGAIGMVAILVAAFVLQLMLNELPCPLCNLQRVAFALCGFGFLLNLRFGGQPGHYGLILLAALFGIAVAGRQTVLHIVPGTGAYGSAILGFHFYSWALILFFAVVVGVALLLVLSGAGRADHGRSDGLTAARFRGVARLIAYLLIAVTLANATATFVQCGPIECADNPKTYWLLQRL